MQANTNSYNPPTSSVWWVCYHCHVIHAESEAASEPWSYSLYAAYARQLPCLWVRLAGGAQKPRHKEVYAGKLGAGFADPVGKTWQRCLAAAYVWIGSDTDESLPSDSPGPAREVEGTQAWAGRKGRKGRCGKFAKGGHLQEPLSSSVLSLEGTHHRGERSKFKVCLPSESVFCFDE